MMAPVVSVIICTRNRAAALRETLASLAQVCVSPDIPCELVVVDNGSTDDTAQVVQEYRLSQMPVRLVREPLPGLSHARNRALAEAQGQILLWTDDDIRLPEKWVEGMCGLILRGEADAVVGGVRFAPHLQKEWMTTTHRVRLAEKGMLEEGHPPSRMAGANMAFSRNVLARVPAFDTELGAGALGFAEETLFTQQMLAAGFRLVSAYDVVVEHHFDASRLGYAFLLAMAQGHERSNAYVAWHWEHQNYQAVHLRVLARRIRLALMRLTRRRELRGAAPPPWEENHVEVIAFFRQYLAERRRPRNYEKQGLIKKNL